jgi:hypothetical protein
MNMQRYALAGSSSINDEDAIYTPQFEQYIRDFQRDTNNEIPLPDLMDHLQRFHESNILQILMKDPTHEMAKACLKALVSSSRTIPQEFVSRFLTIVSMKVSIVPQNITFINQSYNAKIIINNIKPTEQITRQTIDSKVRQLASERHHNMEVYKPLSVPPTQTVKFQFDAQLLQKCVNSMVELYQTIEEGNRSNGFEIDDYIRKNVKYS